MRCVCVVCVRAGVCGVCVWCGVVCVSESLWLTLASRFIPCCAVCDALVRCVCVS